MAHSSRKRPTSRREILRALGAIGGLAVVAAALEACTSSGSETLAPTRTTRGEVAPTSTPRPSPTVSLDPTATPAPTSTARPNPTATAKQSPTSPPDPTRTSEPIPTASAQPTALEAEGSGRVAFVKTRDRADGVRRALALLGVNPAHGNRVLLKPNFNSADPAPGSTHDDVLRTLVEELWGMGARRDHRRRPQRHGGYPARDGTKGHLQDGRRDGLRYVGFR